MLRAPSCDPRDAPNSFYWKFFRPFEDLIWLLTVQILFHNKKKKQKDIFLEVFTVLANLFTYSIGAISIYYMHTVAIITTILFLCCTFFFFFFFICVRLCTLCKRISYMNTGANAMGFVFVYALAVKYLFKTFMQ